MASLIHDTRNMVSAMDLYCALLAEPDVLSAPFRHYASELQLIATSCRRLLDKMAVAEAKPTPPHSESRLDRPGRLRLFLDGHPMESLADELQANQNLLAAMAGPEITIALSIEGGHRPVSMTRDDFTRIMVNLVKNAADAMPHGGHIQISLREERGSLLLTVEDSGPGIPEDALEQIFSSGYSTNPNAGSSWASGSDPASGFGLVRHRGLGLSIVRSVVAAAGGSVKAFNRKGNPGAILQIELPCRASPSFHS
jgi:signal transduction histidine kinase